jgi:hypothetical protein
MGGIRVLRPERRKGEPRCRCRCRCRCGRRKKEATAEKETGRKEEMK